jgi:hypothetical protein
MNFEEPDCRACRNVTQQYWQLEGAECVEKERSINVIISLVLAVSIKTIVRVGAAGCVQELYNPRSVRWSARIGFPNKGTTKKCDEAV